ncbi:HTH-type transcriptional activator HxlR [Roseibium album]|nr:HTH-type transcriptional activator HxlR [Roseibium album]
MKFSDAPIGCPMDSLLQIISGPWTTYILWRLVNLESVRFGELKRLVPGISSRVLTERLRKLEDAGFVTRTYKPTIPPEVSYALSDRGLELKTILNQLADLSIKWELAESCEAQPLRQELQPSAEAPPIA